MKYIGIDIDIFGRAIFCPHCGWNALNNQDIDCHVCGMVIINKCADTQKISENGWKYTQPSCNTILDGKSRFCITCGNMSTFFINKYLDSWEEDKDANFDKYS